MMDFANSLFNNTCFDVFGSSDAFSSWIGDSPIYDWSQWTPVKPFKASTVYLVNDKKLDKELVSSDYPPSDILIDSDKNLVLKLAVAGYSKEDISITQSDIDNNYLVVSIVPKKEEADVKDTKKPNKVYLQKAISKRKAFVKYYVDPKKFDISKVSASMEDGILTITIAKNDTAKTFKPISIN